MSQSEISPKVIEIANVLDELDLFVRSEPALAAFASATAMLVAIGRDVRNGLQVGVVVPIDRSLKIPTRDLAQGILDIINRAPGSVDGESESTAKLMAVLHHNLARSVVFAIIADYPELMRD